MMLPAWAQAPPLAAPGRPKRPLALVALGILCSGLAYLAFFTLMRDIGPSRTLTIGLIIPVLGVLWGWLFLDEAVTLAMLAGIALVLARSASSCGAEASAWPRAAPSARRGEPAQRAGGEGQAPGTSGAGSTGGSAPRCRRR